MTLKLTLPGGKAIQHKLTPLTPSMKSVPAANSHVQSTAYAVPVYLDVVKIVSEAPEDKKVKDTYAGDWMHGIKLNRAAKKWIMRSVQHAHDDLLEEEQDIVASISAQYVAKKSLSSKQWSIMCDFIERAAFRAPGGSKWNKAIPNFLAITPACQALLIACYGDLNPYAKKQLDHDCTGLDIDL